MSAPTPQFLQNDVKLRREYVRELRRLGSGGCSYDCAKGELDRKYARLAQKQANLAKAPGRR